MKYLSSQVNQMTWPEWNDTMAKELNDAGFRARGYNSETGKWEDNRALFQAYPSEPKTFILGAVGGTEEINYLKQIGLLNNGRCPKCGNPIKGNPARFTSGYDNNCHFQICQNCCSHGRKTSINPANNSGCMLALILLPWYMIKSIL